MFVKEEPGGIERRAGGGLLSTPQKIGGMENPDCHNDPTATPKFQMPRGVKPTLIIYMV